MQYCRRKKSQVTSHIQYMYLSAHMTFNPIVAIFIS